MRERALYLAFSESITLVMSHSPYFAFSVGITLVVGTAAFIIGVLRWTGRLKEWANPYRPDIAGIFRTGRSPLTLISGSLMLLSLVAFVFATKWSTVIAYLIALAIVIPSGILFILIRLFRPGWADPPWLATYDWDQVERAYTAAMPSPEISVFAAVDAVEAAIAARKLPLLEAAYHDLASAPKSALAEHSAQIGPRLAGLLSEMPEWHSAVYAVLVGALVEWNADAVACAPPILSGLRESLERAVEFAGLWRERYGDEEDPPNPEGMPSGEMQDALGPDYATVWHAPYFGWLTVHKWEKAAVAVLADPRVRRMLANRRELVEWTERLEPVYGDLRWVQRALLLLDDEPLLVLDRASRRGFRMRMSGITCNYQLQTLLAGVLIGGGHVPGEAPSPEAIAMSRDARIDLENLDALPYAVECFNFAEPSGRWIWSATTPSRIPVVDGIRQLVLDPPVFRHFYRAVRLLPRVPGRLELEEVLEPDEAAPYFAHVQELMPEEEASRLAADGY